VRILVANGDATLLRIVERGLRGHGFEVVAIDNASSAMALIADESLALALLDTSLYDFDGAALLGALAGRRANLPLLLLTYDAEEIEQASAHGLTADDYLVKPFALEELIGRIRAKTRPENERPPSVLQLGDLRIDLMARCAWRGERVIDLPTREFALLEYFMRHPGRVLSRADILTDVWGYNFASESNLVDVYVRYLRNRIDRPGERSLVATVRGAGYRFDAPAAAERPAEAGIIAHER
jgi:DNA-binding response OmpR family regulator